jgi:O-antigen/teichoic acid export membrane protein
VFALFVAMILTRLLEEEVYGIYRKVWLIYGISGPIFISSLVNTLYYQRSDPEATNRSVWGAVLLSVGYGGLVSAFLWIASPWLADLINAPIAQALQNFAWYAGLSVVAGLAEPLFVLAHRKKGLLAYNLGYNLIEASLIAGAFYLGYPLERVMLVMAMGPALRLIILVVWLFRGSYHWPGLREAVSVIPESLRYGVGLMLTAIVGIAVKDIDNWIVSWAFQSNVIYAIYAIGARKVPFISAYTNSVSSGLVMQFSPQLKQGDFRAIGSSIRTQTNRVWLLLVPALMVGWIFTEEILVWVFEKATYAQSAPIFRIYLLLLIPNMLFPQSVLLGTGKSYVQARFSMIELVLNIGLSILLVRAIGLVGPAWASLVGGLTYTWLHMWYCRKQYGMSMRRFLPDGSTLLRLTGLAVIGAVAYYLKTDWLWVSFLGFGTLAAAFVYWFGLHSIFRKK